MVSQLTNWPSMINRIFVLIDRGGIAEKTDFVELVAR